MKIAMRWSHTCIDSRTHQQAEKQNFVEKQNQLFCMGFNFNLPGMTLFLPAVNAL